MKLHKSCAYFTLLFLAAVLLTSCSAQWHLRKAISKDPNILVKPQTVKVDTVIITEAVHATDTFTLREHDTIVNTVNGIEYKIIRRVDTFEVDIKCPPDTIFFEKVVECPPQVVYQPKNWLGRNYWWIVIVVGLFFAARFVVKKHPYLLRK